MSTPHTPPKPPLPTENPTPFDRFRRLANGVIQVPKAEADKAEAKWQKKRAESKKKRKKANG
jgi:hypothetical protein